MPMQVHPAGLYSLEFEVAAILSKYSPVHRLYNNIFIQIYSDWIDIQVINYKSKILIYMKLP